MMKKMKNLKNLNQNQNQIQKKMKSTASKARRTCKNKKFKKNKKIKTNKKINVLAEAPAEAVARKIIKILK